MSKTPDSFPGVEWVKSSYSGNGGGNCIEWAPTAAVAGQVPVRDSKVPAGPALSVSVASWSAFVDFAKAASV